MRKVVVTLLLLSVVCAVSAQQVGVCETLARDMDRLRSEINQTRKSDVAKLRKLYKAMIDDLKKSENCSGHEGDSIRHYTAKLNSLKSSSGNSVFKETHETCSADTGHVYISLKSGNITILRTPSWTDAGEVRDNKTLVIYAQRNDLPYDREDTVAVRNNKTNKVEYLILRQEAAMPIALITESYRVGQDGGYGTIFVETNDTSWSAVSSADWVTATVDKRGVSLYCKSNPSKKKRTATVTVALGCGKVTRKVNVTQAIGRTQLSVPNELSRYACTGGSQDAVVNCNYDQWSATPMQKWVTVTKKYGGIRIECDENPHAESRRTYVKVETNDDDYLVRYIDVVQDPSPATLILTDDDTYYSNGETRSIYVPVKTNVADWTVKCTYGSSWSTVSRYSDDKVKVTVYRNDANYARTATYEVRAQDKSARFSVYQPNRGYAGRYRDYFYANGDWRITWFSIDFHGLTTVGDNISTCNFRWKPVEASLANFNIDYLMCDDISVNWEPLVRGFLPITRDGKWAGFLSLGAHINLTGEAEHHFLVELGAEVNWTEKYSSRIFFKYNGGFSMGMSIDIGKWY